VPTVLDLMEALKIELAKLEKIMNEIKHKK